MARKRKTPAETPAEQAQEWVGLLTHKLNLGDPIRMVSKGGRPTEDLAMASIAKGTRQAAYNELDLRLGNLTGGQRYVLTVVPLKELLAERARSARLRESVDA